MKKIIFKIMFLLSLAPIVVSCQISSGYKPDNKTESGYFVYNYTTQNALSVALNGLDISLKIDDIRSESDFISQIELSDKYFPTSRVRYKEGEYKVSSSNYIIIIDTQNKSLRDAEAHWILYFEKNNEKIKWFDIYQLSDMSFNVKYNKVGFMDDSVIDLIVNASPLEDDLVVNDRLVYKYTFSGNGSIFETKKNRNENKTYAIDYEISDKLSAYPSLVDTGSTGLHLSQGIDFIFFIFYGGSMNMTVKGNNVVNGSQEVKANVSSLIYDTEIEITYRGVTEVWSR